MVARVVKSPFPGHLIHRPKEWRLPIIFASPHSGRHYPARFLESTILPLEELRRCEDAYVDALLPAPDQFGIPVLQARFPRVFVDVNRDPRELDGSMFSSPPVESPSLQTHRLQAGFGVLPKLAAAGRPIYARKLAASDARARLKWCYDPYHLGLRTLINEAKKQFGRAIVIDWHSMPSFAAGPGRTLPDIVIGDRYGESVRPEVSVVWREAFKDAGLTVSRNAPYAGGYVTTLYGQPASDVQVLQIEINRALYLDEENTARLPGAFEALSAKLASVIQTATGALGDAIPLAAE